MEATQKEIFNHQRRKLIEEAIELIKSGFIICGYEVGMEDVYKRRNDNTNYPKNRLAQAEILMISAQGELKEDWGKEWIEDDSNETDLRSSLAAIPAAFPLEGKNTEHKKFLSDSSLMDARLLESSERASEIRRGY